VQIVEVMKIFQSWS